MRPALRSTAIALAAASFLALLEILRTSLTRAFDAVPATPMMVVHRVMAVWILMVVVSPWCAFMARRFPMRPRRAWRTISAHAVGGMIFVALHMALMMAYHNTRSGAVPWPFGPGLLHLFAFYVGMEMSVYVAIVLVILLFDAHREAAARSVTEALLSRNLAAARLSGLQAQIQPHFLFNTLNALAVLARRGDGEAVDRAIGDLGELLRASFDTSGRSEIPLGEELDLLERYVGLQRIRFPGRLEVEWDVEPAARAARVPPLVVQPLVENALEHGLASAAGGRVRVSARREADHLVITVHDDGPGFPAGAPSPGGVGLANTRERLALLYGEQGSLEVAGEGGRGGQVRIRVPWQVAAAKVPA